MKENNIAHAAVRTLTLVFTASVSLSDGQQCCSASVRVSPQPARTIGLHPTNTVIGQHLAIDTAGS